MNGVEAVKRICQLEDSEKSLRVPIVAVTANGF